MNAAEGRTGGFGLPDEGEMCVFSSGGSAEWQPDQVEGGWKETPTVRNTGRAGTLEGCMHF